MPSAAITPRANTSTVSEAVVKLRIGEDTSISVAEGNGPINALDLALRRDLGKYQPFIEISNSSIIVSASSRVAPMR